MHFSRPSARLLPGFFTIVLIGWHGTGFSQKLEADTPAGGASPPRAVPVVADAAAASMLRQVHDMIERQEFFAAAEILGQLAASDGVVTVRLGDAAPALRSLQAEAEELLSAGPAGLLEAYEVAKGPLAKAMLEAAVANSDRDQLRRLQSRYLFTAAGAEAARLLAQYHVYQGDCLAASLYLRRLVRYERGSRKQLANDRLRLAAVLQMSGETSASARQIEVIRANPPRRFVVGGREIVPPRRGEDPILWLKRSLGLGARVRENRRVWQGSERGSVGPAAGLPRLGKESAAILLDPQISSVVKEIRKIFRERDIARIPAARPVAAVDLLMLRRPNGLLAVESATGQIRWRVPSENPWLELARTSAVEHLSPARRTEALARRLYDDISWGAISTDGQQLYVLEDWGFDSGTDQATVLARRDDLANEPGGESRRSASRPRLSNTLSAYDVRTGKRVWQIGGPFAESTPGMQGVRFLGPPLPFSGRLYAVAEYADSTALAVIGSDGRLRRQWLLGFPGALAEKPPAGVGVEGPLTTAPPIFAGGLIVCAIRNGEFAAVDPLNGAIRWTYQIPEVGKAAVPDPSRRGRDTEAQLRLRARRYRPDRWTASEAVVAGDFILLTDVDADSLCTLDLFRGELRWSIPRGDGLFVERIEDDAVLVVGRSAVRSLNVSDGSPLWSQSYPVAAVPCGRGCRYGDAYALPLSNGEIVVFDLLSGGIVGEILPRQPQPLGNLVACRDALYSVAPDAVRRLTTVVDARADRRVGTPPAADASLSELAAFDLAAGKFDAALRRLEGGDNVERITEAPTLYVRALMHAIRRKPEAYKAEIMRIAGLPIQGTEDTRARVSLAHLLIELERREEAAEIAVSLPSAGDIPREMAPAGVGRRVRLDRQVLGLRQHLRGEGLLDLGNRARSCEGRTADPDSTQPFLDLFACSVTVQARDEDPAGRVAKWGDFDVASTMFIGEEDPELQLNYNKNTGTFWALDRFGVERLRLDLPLPKDLFPRAARSIRRSLQTYQAILADDVLVFHRGDAVFGVTWNQSNPRVIWHERLRFDTDESTATEQIFLQEIREANVAWTEVFKAGFFTWPPPASNPRLLAVPDTGGLCYQRGKQLRCVEPRTGQLLWSRDEFGLGSDLHGSDRRLRVNPIVAEDATIVSSFDGRELSGTPATRVGRRIGCSRGNMLQLSGRELTLVDPFRAAPIWQRKLPAKSLVSCEGDLLGVLDRNGRLDVHRAGSGELRASVDLSPIQQPINLYLLPYDEILVVAVDERRGYRSSGWNNGFKQLTGHLFGVDLANHHVVWRYETEEGSVLRREQPPGLPLVVLSGRYRSYSRRKNKKPQAAILACLDVRSGEVLEESRVERAYYANNGAGYRLAFDPADRIATLETPNRTVFVAFAGADADAGWSTKGDAL